MHSRLPSRCLSALAVATLASACAAQVMQAPGTLPDGRRVPIPGAWQSSPQSQTPSLPAAGPLQPAHSALTAASPSTPASVPPTVAAVAPSLLDHPAEPAKVLLAAGELSVDANNSSLSAILHQVGTSSGMTIEGLDEDARIFGSYGPGSPRDILSALLDGAGYNVMMFGVTEAGAPRELVLSARSSAPLATGQPASLARDDEDQDELPVNNYPPAGEISPVARPPVAPSSQQSPNSGVKSPAQMLQELQQLRQQQQQQQPQ